MKHVAKRRVMGLSALLAACTVAGGGAAAASTTQGTAALATRGLSVDELREVAVDLFPTHAPLP